MRIGTELSLILNKKDEVVTMTSLEIAELCDKEHCRILQTIRENLELIYTLGNNGLANANFRAPVNTVDLTLSYLDAQGKERPMYRLNFNQSLFIVTGFSNAARAAVIKRWSELENNKYVLPSNFKEALLALIKSEDEKQLALDYIRANKENICYAEELLNSEGEISLTELAGLLGGSRNTLYEQLRNIGVLMKYKSSKNLPYQKYRVHFGRDKITLNLEDGGKITTASLKIKSIFWLINKLKENNYLEQSFNLSDEQMNELLNKIIGESK